VIFFLPTLAKIWLPWQLPIETCDQKCLIQISRPRQTPVISNHTLVISRRNAFIAILVPKLIAMVTPLCPCVLECHTLIRWQLKPYLKTKHTTEVMAILRYFCPFWLKFGCTGNIPWNFVIRNVFFRGSNHENPVISNHILVISHRNVVYDSCTQWYAHTRAVLKGTLRRRLSHGYFSFIAKYTSNWLMSHRSHPQIFTFKGAGPNFLALRGEIWSMLW